MKNKEELQRRLYTDQARLLGLNYAPYRGAISSPMSAMTQNAIKMRQEAQTRSPAYANKIEEVLKRPNGGLSEEQANNLLEILRKSGNSSRIASKIMKNQFSRNYGYSPENKERLKGKIGKDIERGMALSAKNLKDVSDDFALLEGKRAIHIAGALDKAGKIKTAKKEGLTKQLEEFGNQEHALENLKNKAARDVFEEEQAAPFRRINKAAKAIRGINVEEMHPDIVNAENARIAKITNAYNLPHANYPGERVIGVQPDTKTSFDIANRISPKYKDDYYNERKAMENEFLKGRNLASKAYDNLPANLEPLMSRLDLLTKQKLKDVSKKIAGKHVRLGTYGSGAHKAQTEKAMRGILRKIQGEREGVVLSGLKTNLEKFKTNEMNNLNRYNAINELGEKEFNNILKQNAELNKRGWITRANKQAQENDALQNWYRQLNHEWNPSMKAQLGSGGVGGPGEMPQGKRSKRVKSYQTDLTSLFSHPQIYNEENKAANPHADTANKDFVNQREFYERERRLQAEAEQRAQAEAAQRAQLEAEQREQQRAQAANAAEQRARAEAEAAAQRARLEAEAPQRRAAKERELAQIRAERNNANNAFANYLMNQANIKYQHPNTYSLGIPYQADRSVLNQIHSARQEQEEIINNLSGPQYGRTWQEIINPPHRTRYSELENLVNTQLMPSLTNRHGTVNEPFITRAMNQMYNDWTAKENRGQQILRELASNNY
jgi:hypothetical protein